jgi:predicted kinase
MSPIFFITGAPGSGKSTIARRVAQHFDKSIHIQVDQLREMMVNGIILPEPGAEFSPEVHQQFRWARDTAIYMARLYARQGFVVVVDDVCVPAKFTADYAALFTSEVHRVLLLPTAPALVKRLENRAGPFDQFFITQVSWMYEYLEPMPKAGWTVLDSSHWSIEQTVEAVLNPPAKTAQNLTGI